MSTSIERTATSQVGTIAAYTFGVLVLGLTVASLPLSAAINGLRVGIMSQGAIVLTFGAVGVVVAIRQPRNAMGWILLAAGFFFVLSDDASLYSVLVYRHHEGWRPLAPLAVLAQPSWAPAIVLFGLAVLLFPDAQLPSHGWLWVIWGVLAAAALWMVGAFIVAADAIAQHKIAMDSSGNLVQLDHPTGDWAWWGVSQDVFFPVLGLGWLSSLARQIGTYRHSTRDRKLQLQWLMVGASLAMVGGLFSVIGSDSSSQTLRVAAGIGTACFVGLPVSIGIAILKYRLYDIDRLISRSLSYATVSGLLIGVYFGIVVLSTDVLSFSSPVAVAASTLTAAALFNPVRRAVQRQVDRRFNRTGYDAEATIAEFVARLRESVTIDAVRSDLLDVVGSAVEPANASIWMKPQR